ncbi:hypothetical protein TRICI_006429 [Trichomonascus ciferrii]|uniref:Homeobox domain-containing protein n=1 Tax=Trichomonascus ciferrii TaxID=44093 RepID=A0A642UH97_9ASCO|nr:hypothetical protein TRICI_006429 [Trichomonascus ciferrii]
MSNNYNNDIYSSSTPAAAMNGNSSTHLPHQPTANPSHTSHKPRKSNLTQQQKNKKRQRASNEQLEVLRKEFEENPTPDAAKRTEIGDRIDMTERSVQIWFQNKRAKVKQQAQKQKEQQQQQMAYYGENGGGHKYNLHGTSNGGNYLLGSGYYSSPGMSRFSSPLDSSQSTPPGMANTDYGACYTGGVPPGVCGELMNPFLAPAIQFSCFELVIGSWSRALRPEAKDLFVCYFPSDSTIIYTVFAKGIGFKIVVPIKAVDKIRLVQDPLRHHVGNAILTINDTNKLSFLVREPNKQQWRKEVDFTTNRQVMTSHEHCLIGSYSELQTEMNKLYSFQPSKFADHSLTPPRTSPFQETQWPNNSESGEYLSAAFNSTLNPPSTNGTDMIVDNSTLAPSVANDTSTGMDLDSTQLNGSTNIQSQWLISDRFETKSTPASMQFTSPTNSSVSNPQSDLFINDCSMSDPNLPVVANGQGFDSSTNAVFNDRCNENITNTVEGDDTFMEGLLRDGDTQIKQEDSNNTSQFVVQVKTEDFTEDYLNPTNGGQSSGGGSETLHAFLGDTNSTPVKKEEPEGESQTKTDSSLDRPQSQPNKLGLSSPTSMSPITDSAFLDGKTNQYILDNPPGNESMLLEGFNGFSFSLDETVDCQNSSSDPNNTANDHHYDSSLFI